MSHNSDLVSMRVLFGILSARGSHGSSAAHSMRTLLCLSVLEKDFCEWGNLQDLSSLVCFFFKFLPYHCRYGKGSLI